MKPFNSLTKIFLTVDYTHKNFMNELDMEGYILGLFSLILLRKVKQTNGINICRGVMIYRYERENHLRG